MRGSVLAVAAFLAVSFYQSWADDAHDVNLEVGRFLDVVTQRGEKLR